MCWISVKDEAGTIVFALLFGFFSGTYVSLPPAVVSSITKDMSKIGARLSLCFFIVGFGVLVGTPIAGALIQRQNGGFLGAQLFSGACILLASLFMAWSRHVAGGHRGLVVKV
jgi:MFS family permease